MSAFKIAPFESTPVLSIPATVNLCATTFRAQKTKPLSYRLTQLRKLYWSLNDRADEVVEALKQDLGKPSYETFLGEIDWCKNDIVFITKNLHKWMKDEKGPDTALINSLLNPKIRKEPLGTVLVIGAFNVPVNLSIGPLVGAIAAGCTAVLKPSEVAPATAMVLKKIVEESLDPSAYAVVNGGIAETTALLDEKWDKIFFTGNSAVGTIIAKKAAESLTPVVLELGGRNPAIISNNADPRLAARRLLWGKLFNSGQICLSQNYILVEKNILPLFVEQLKVALKEFYPNGTKNSQDYGRIINHRHFLRIKKMLDESQGKILMGGEVDESQNYIDITVIQVESEKDSLIAEESFGPLIPILAVDSIDDAIRIANSVDSTPLALYPFGTKAEAYKILDHVTSGGATINDAYYHASIATLPFGGVGSSGSGSYRGRASFDAFTHRRSYATTPGWMESLISIRYPPYAGKLGQLRRTTELKPNFNRGGEEIKGLGYWTSFVLSLGGESKKSVLGRWLLAVLVALGTKRYANEGRLPGYLR